MSAMRANCRARATSPTPHSARRSQRSRRCARERCERGKRGFWLAPAGASGAAGPHGSSRARCGVYLYGGVGRGKTMLMDLFYDSLPQLGRRRSHFHHFMRDVHEQLRQFSSRRAPLEAVARSWRPHTVLCLDELYVSDIADAMILGAPVRSAAASWRAARHHLQSGTARAVS
jgi:predicted ATPase